MSNIKKLPDSELEVMQAIWQFQPPVTREEINSVLQNSHPIAQTTLLTFLSRLAEKEFIKIEKQGKISVYTALVSKEDYLASQSSWFFDKLCSKNIKAFASALCSSNLSKEDLQELKDLLDKNLL